MLTVSQNLLLLSTNAYSKMKQNTNTNPWAGLSSYEDPSTTERNLKFCGRDDESYDVAKLIMGNTFVTLYGKSGIGKTSLLNAGVFPELREKLYSPLSLRLGIRDENNPKSYQAIIIESVKHSVSRIEEIDVIPTQNDQLSVDYLWKYFASHRFYDKDDNPITPVVILDQFEEIFRSHYNEAETLLRQFDACAVNGSSNRYKINVRFVVSIREDDLYRLEDSIDNYYLPALKRCRYRLRSLTEQGARDAILIPGKGLFKEGEQEQIAQTIIQIARNKDDNSISTNILSLVCNRLYVESQKSGFSSICLSHVDSFVKDNPFERFYKEATRGFTNKEKSYIEEHLVDSTGRRNSIPESDFMARIKNGEKLIEGQNRILQRVSTSADGGNSRIELLHDSFCAPLEVLRQKRSQWKRIRLMVGAFVLSICVVGVAWIYIKNIEKANEQMRENEILTAISKSQMYLNQGDSYRARMALLDILPKSEEEKCSPSLEAALRSATRRNSAILTGHIDAVNRACYNSDGTLIASTSYDKTIKLWNVINGKCIKTFNGHEAWVIDVSFLCNDKQLVSYSADGIVKIWDIDSGSLIRDLTKMEDNCWGFLLSPNKKHILLLNNQAQLYNAETFECIKAFEGSEIWNDVVWHPNGEWLFVYTERQQLIKVCINTGISTTLTQEQYPGYVLLYLNISNDGKKIAGAFGNKQNSGLGFVKVWDGSNGSCLHILKDKNSWTNGVTFSPDGKTLVSTSMNGDVRLWDAKEGVCLDIWKGNSLGSGSPCYSPDGNYMLTTSADNTTRIWDMRPENETKNLNINSYIYYSSYNGNGDRILLLTKDSICEYDVNTMTWLYTLPSPPVHASFGVNYAEDGTILAACATNDSLYLWNQAKKEWQRKLKGKDVLIEKLALTKDFNEIACFTTDSILHIWDLTNEKLITNLGKIHSECWNLSYSKDGTLLVQECSDSTIRIWNTKKWECIQTIKTTNEALHPSLVTIDNKYLITSRHKTAYLWDIKTGECIREFEGHTSIIYDFAQSNNGKYLATCSHDCYVKVWDIASGTCVQSSFNEQFTHITFNPQTDKLCAGASDGIYVSFIDFPPLQQLIDNTRERFTYISKN